MVEVRRGLLLGSEGDAEVVADGQKRRLTVTHILSVTGKPPRWLNPGPATPTVANDSEKEQKSADKAEARPKFATLFIQATDLSNTDLLHRFEECCGFIQQGVEQGNVLVHCVYGISRSATVVLAYLMWKEGRPLQVLLRELQSKKPDYCNNTYFLWKLLLVRQPDNIGRTIPPAVNITPNPGFIEQLELWGAMKCHIDASHKGYKLYRLKVMANSTHIKKEEVVKSVMSADPTKQTQDSTAYYKCRKCRRLLYTEESILLHQVGKGFDVHKGVKGSVSLGEGQKSDSSPICSSHFIEPVEWMKELLLGNMEGKVSCPKCNARLGSFSWIGHQCSCGQWVNPSFQIHKAKVDEIRTLTRRKHNTQLN